LSLFGFTATFKQCRDPQPAPEEKNGEDMRIVAVETSIVSLPYDMGGPHPAFAGRPWTQMEILLVKVETEGGLVGWGEAFGHACIPATKAALDTIVAPLVLGRDSGDIATLAHDVLRAVHLLGRNGPFVYAFSGIEIALWDIKGKRSGLPLYRILGGGEPRADVPAYASLLRYGDPDLAARNAAAAAGQGFRYIKLHEVTREAVMAAKAACSAQQPQIMLDVNCAWTVDQACRMADALRPDGLCWLEEPVWPPEDYEGLAEVRRRGIPIAAGENAAGLHAFLSLAKAGGIDIAQPSVTKIGGIGEMLRVIERCGPLGVKVAPHSPYFGPGFIATLHICAALTPESPIEVLWADMEANPFDPWVRTQGGRARVPQGPGLGCEPDSAVLERYQQDKLVRHTWRSETGANA
jgi:D-galactarolactone cycloisomerase